MNGTAEGFATGGALVIRLEIEAAPVVFGEWANDAEAVRLADWLNTNRALLELALDALDAYALEGAA